MKYNVNCSFLKGILILYKLWWRKLLIIMYLKLSINMWKLPSQMLISIDFVFVSRVATLPGNLEYLEFDNLSKTKTWNFEHF